MTDPYLKQLKEKPCECVTCPDCLGFGYIDDPFDYSGRGPDECYTCEGGMMYICERCLEIEEIERDDYLQ